jgi:hypothetical protein
MVIFYKEGGDFLMIYLYISKRSLYILPIFLSGSIGGCLRYYLERNNTEIKEVYHERLEGNPC